MLSTSYFADNGYNDDYKIRAPLSTSSSSDIPPGDTDAAAHIVSLWYIFPISVSDEIHWEGSASRAETGELSLLTPSRCPSEAVTTRV